MNRKAFAIIQSNLSRWAVGRIHLLLALSLSVYWRHGVVSDAYQEGRDRGPFSISLPVTSTACDPASPTSVWPSLPAVTPTDSAPLWLKHIKSVLTQSSVLVFPLPGKQLLKIFPLILWPKDIPLKGPSLATLWKINPQLCCSPDLCLAIVSFSTASSNILFVFLNI